MTRDHMSAVRGKLAGLHQRAQAVNTAHAARGRDIAHTDHEAAHMPGTGSTGPRSSDTPDPTHNAATRPRPPAPHQLELDTLRALDAVAAYIHQMETWARWGDPDPKLRKPPMACAGGTLHQPNDKGGCDGAGCTLRWPSCSPDGVPRFEECHGTAADDDGRCARCNLKADHAICRDCLEVKERRQMKTSARCNACAQAAWRSRQAS